MKPKIIETEKEYDVALAHVDRLMSAKAGTPELEELQLWTLLVEAYEDKHYPIERPDPVAAIQFRMEQQGLKQVDLVPFIGSKSKVSEVLSGRRSLSIAMIRRLHEGLGIPAEVLLGEVECGRSGILNSKTRKTRQEVRSTCATRTKRKPGLSETASAPGIPRVAEDPALYGRRRKEPKGNDST